MNKNNTAKRKDLAQPQRRLTGKKKSSGHAHLAFERPAQTLSRAPTLFASSKPWGIGPRPHFLGLGRCASMDGESLYLDYAGLSLFELNRNKLRLHVATSRPAEGSSPALPRYCLLCSISSQATPGKAL
ncbi:uncharacterized protein CLUP02_08007 [Colletotrichum lupini]|uniref:Uncharacterized protein n=1 Tax=Colletotrichum lupini TaxID=145971 RepID=A0A9Q8SS32_9PEZI|nr:uncharacterized protein CLUP02_08007 [Colletotrichum lupini]UQC82519.1 hypothetical protein CLUP02_08007 [Colletotrichum lupini]